MCSCDVVSAEKTNALSEPREEESLTKKGKKKKTVHWPEDEQLKNYFYFDLDETERGKVCISLHIFLLWVWLKIRTGLVLLIKMR